MVKELGKSAAQFARGLVRHFAWLILGVLLGILGLVELQTGGGVSVPGPVFWSVLAAGLFVAAFLAYHDLRRATIREGTSEARLAVRRIRDDFAEVRHRLLEFDVGDPMRLKEFMDDPVTHGLPTRGWGELARLEAVLSPEDYSVVLYAYIAIDKFNKTKGGVQVMSDELKTGSVRQAIKRAEAVLP